MRATKFRNGIKRVLAAILSTLIWLNVFSGALVYMGGFIAHADEPAQMYTIRNTDDFEVYSVAYAQGYRNPKDVLNISINEGSIVTTDGFISLGTQSRPFEGTLIISSIGLDVFHLFDCPLFDYVTTDLRITGAGTVKIQREQANDMPADGVLTSGALFANHVVAGTNAANWSIAFMPLEGNGIPSTSFEGLIGDIAANCDVTVTFDNTTNLAVSASGNVGLICGTLGEGAKLTVTTAGSGGNISVTSSAGNAGGLVGEMKNGSTLKYNTANNSRVNSVTSTNGYAGGVVGSADRITVEYASGVTDYAVSGTITGKTGSGGVFGKYVTDAVSSETFTLLNTYAIASGTAVLGTGNCCCGGVFGVLENNADSFTFDGNSETIAVSLSGGKYHGGVCGSYKAAALTETFTVQNTVTSLTASVLTNDKYTAGLIGKVDNTPAYINIHDVSCGVTGGLNGGLVGYAGTGGSFIDLTGNVTITGSSTLDAGLVANIPSGVLRLSGVFDFAGFSARSSAASGYLVKDRGRALIYALGDGEGSAGNWTFKRNTSPGIDDIHSWGEVIRCDGTKLKESDLFTVDMTAHTVAVKAAVTAMGSVTDFAKTALNIKLNTGADVGALKFESSTRSATLLSGSLSLTSDIALTGTGLLGLARDDGGNDPFSGTFNGGGHTITFATGEKYGLQANGSALPANSIQGSIYQHAYTGLFAETNNATVQNVNLAGTYRLRPNVAGIRAAGVSAYATGGLNLSSVNVSLSVSEYVSGDFTEYFGGAVAVATGNGLNISVSNCNVSPTVTDISSSAGDASFFVGGAIGYVTTADEAAAAPSQTVSFANSTLGLNYNKTGNADRASVFGAAIAGVANCRYGKDKRQISFNTVAVNIDVDNGRTKNRRFGAILGTDWYAADVTVNGVTVNADIAATAGGAADFGGLVRTATGHWDVQKINLTTANLSYPSAGGSTFGFVTNITSNKTPSTVNADGALYLDVNNRTVSGVDNYDISALTVSGPTFAVFDEIAADSRFRTDADHVNDIVSNGNSVISITTTDNGLISSAGDTYYNKTAYGQSANGAVNANTRYYYNLAYARANTSTQKFKFLTWSAGIYAHSTLSNWFTVADSTFSGDLDMTGLSYYPVDLTKSVTFSGATLKLDNITMESRVNKAYSADGGSRTTRADDNQHYLMHTAVFRNDPTSQITISNSMTLQGNVPKMSDSFCGFLVAGELGDADNATAKLTATNIALDGAHIITDTGADLTTSAYAPLLVNKVGKNSNVTINGVAQSNTAYSGYASKYIASSLIGDVGYATARAISLRFTGLKLDGRSAATSIGNMDTVYGTTKSLFSRATILNSFTFAGESSGSYNFEIEKDWSGSTAVHNVTYGHELTNSVEYANKQKMYYGSETYYTHPTVAQSTAEYNFSSGFMPYVYHAANATTAYNVANKTHELMVNVNVTAVIEGCGKYNDPYIIDNNDKLPIIAKIIANDTTVLGGGVQLYLPKDYDSYDYVKMSNYNNVKYKYTSGTDNFTREGTTSTVTTANVRKYLAGAYYAITTDIELDKAGCDVNFIGLGTVDSAGNTQYAFRGQLIGYGSNITITNHSDEPLINTSMGCVVKGLTVNVEVDKNSSNMISLAAAENVEQYNFSGGVQSYGAVIGQILGGDTIIDNTQVVFTDAAFSITNVDSTHPERLTPIGGYVGTLFNGGLIFRNMTSANVGLTSATEPRVADSGYLYINPIIGRVIAGYAFHETSAYRVTSAALNNGDKNYTIPDLSLSETMMTVSGGDVSLPNGQAVYILGAAVNSGAACAPTGDDISAPTAYPGITGSSGNTVGQYWQAYRTQTTVRGGADYSGVGTTDPTSLPDYTEALKDKYTANGNKIPYILRAYTADETSCLALRSLSTVNGVNITLTHDCDVASGFRGIGSIYYYNSANVYNNLSLRIKEFKGYDKTVTLHMDFRHYEETGVTSYQAITDSSSGAGRTSGFGLFNVLKMSSPTESNSIHNIVLSGSIFYDIYTISGVQSQYLCGRYNGNNSGINNYDNSTNDEFRKYTIPTNQVNSEKYLSVGGIAGYIWDSEYYIKDVLFNNFTVEGAKTAGGLVGYVTRKDGSGISYIKYSTSTSITGYLDVIGGLQAGGFIGRIYMDKTEIEGPSGGVNVTVRNIEVKSRDLNGMGVKNYVDNQIVGAGGIVGNCWGRYKDKNPDAADTLQNGLAIPGASGSNQTKRLYISNVNLVKGTQDAKIQIRNDSTNIDDYNSAGGLVGMCHYTLVHINNCKLKDVDIKANFSGGLIGYMSQKYMVHVDGVELDGGGTHSIKGRSYAGGLFGFVNVHDEAHYIDVNNAVVKNYTVESTSTTSSKKCAAGGILGIATGDNRYETFSDFEIRNTTVSNCTIKTNYTNSSSNANIKSSGTGGLIGVSTEKNSKRMRFSGYNILIDNVKLTHLSGGSTDDSVAPTNEKIGDIIGNNYGTKGSDLRFVGVTTKYASPVTYCGRHAGYNGSTAEKYGVDDSGVSGYVVFSDFGNTFTNQTFGGVFNAQQELVSFANDYTDVTLTEPYVTTNPVLDIGTQRALRLTGDGIGANTQSLPINSIIADLDASGQRKYAYAADARYVSSASTTNKALLDSNMSKFAMFRTEATEYLGADFPVLVLESTDHAESTKMINSYLRLLTNTQFDFASDTEAAKKFDVRIYRMSYEQQHFEPYEVGVSLKRDGEAKEFYMHSATFDSGKTQFSLLDVQFYDPATADTAAKKVAYHLYVPVFVKKILSYNFDIALLSGTTYLSSLYDDYGKALIENIGTPVTLFFQYTYSRSEAEWAEAINAGENVNRNYEKSLMFYKANNNAALNDLPGDTILTLYDIKTGKPYYAKLADVLTGTTLDLSKFSVEATNNDGGWTFSYDPDDPDSHFTPPTLSSLMELTAVPETNGPLIACAAEDATVIVGTQGYRPVADNETGTHSIRVGTNSTTAKVQPERYYLSIYTESNATNDELFHYYLITSPSSFNDPGYPSKIEDTLPHTMVHLVMGKIFHHSDLDVDSYAWTQSEGASIDSPVMTATNNELTIELSAEFGLSEDLDADIKQNVMDLIDATEVYQSFIIYLNRKENADISKVILGDPASAGTYSVDNAAAVTYSAASDTIRQTQNYVEFVSGDLHSKFASGNNFTIEATVTLTYSADAIPTQFPGRGDLPPSDNNGVTVSAASNISFQQTATTYSKNTISADETPAKSYYSENDPEVALLDLNPTGDRVGDFTPLGINALNNNNATVADMDLIASLNVTAIADRISGYNDAVLTFRLEQKQADGSYGAPLNISDYMDIDLEDLTGITYDSTSYSQVVPRANLTGTEAEINAPVIHCHVKTGAVLEGFGGKYANYRLTVTMVLRGAGGAVISSSQASNFVIYTNAKIIPYFIVTGQQ